MMPKPSPPPPDLHDVASAGGVVPFTPRAKIRIDITEELKLRPRADASPRAAAVLELSRMSAHPDLLVKKAVAVARDVCGGGSAGVSLLEADEDAMLVFRLVSVVGPLAGQFGIVIPKDASLCGLCLSKGTTTLVTRPHRTYRALRALPVSLNEVLLTPIHDSGGSALGVLWVASHANGTRIHPDQAGLVEDIAAHLATALQAAMGPPR